MVVEFLESNGKYFKEASTSLPCCRRFMLDESNIVGRRDVDVVGEIWSGGHENVKVGVGSASTSASGQTMAAFTFILNRCCFASHETELLGNLLQICGYLQ